jgi:hypothetical protein
MAVFWYVASCSHVDTDGRFRGTSASIIRAMPQDSHLLLLVIHKKEYFLAVTCVAPNMHSKQTYYQVTELRSLLLPSKLIDSFYNLLPYIFA